MYQPSTCFFVLDELVTKWVLWCYIFIVMMRIKIFILFSIFSLLFSYNVFGQLRSFKNQKGQEIIAELTAVTGDIVSIKMTNGKTFDLKINEFSAEDQTYIRDWESKNQVPFDYKAINELFGLPIFTEEMLWNENADSVAKRLRWQSAYENERISSFRENSPSSRLKVLGAHPYSLTLFGEEGKVTEISMVFANTNECVYDTNVVVKTKKSNAMDAEEERRIRRLRDLAVSPLIAEDSKAIKEALDKFGKSSSVTLGKGKWDKETIQGWKNGNYLVLLTVRENAFVWVRIVKPDILELQYFSKKADAVKATVKDNVVKEENGDVVLKNVPNITSGPSATPGALESFLRYSGVPVDAYVLGLMGQYTEFAAQDIQINDMVTNVERWVNLLGVNLGKKKVLFNLRDIQTNIDKGQPVFWLLNQSSLLSSVLRNRVNARKSAESTKAWIEELAFEKEELGRIRAEKGYLSATLVVGYNLESNEIAIVDARGDGIWWVRMDEANAVSSGQYITVN